jgi:hypothetical protein
MKNLKTLTRNQMKNLTGGGDTSRLPGGCTYKCCLNSNPQNCSTSVTFTVEESGSASCVSGAHLVEVV